jgi:hypothetical protein
LVWFGLVWFGLVWFGFGWFGLVWCGCVSLDLVLFGLMQFGANQGENKSLGKEKECIGRILYQILENDLNTSFRSKKNRY